MADFFFVMTNPISRKELCEVAISDTKMYDFPKKRADHTNQTEFFFFMN